MTYSPAPGPSGSQPPQNNPWPPRPVSPPHGQRTPQQQIPTLPPPPKRGPWRAVAVVAALVAVAAISVTTTILWGRHDTSSVTGPRAPSSDLHSANDTGPVGLITEDPSCPAWRPVATTLANAENNGWATRDPSIPVGAWAPDARSQYQAAGEAMRSAADQTVPLVKLTTHRVVRELYEQFIAYSRAYIDRLPNYTPADNDLAIVSSTVSDVLTGICESIANGSAAARAPLVTATAAPDHVAPVGDPAAPARFLTTADPQCGSWKQSADAMKSDPVMAAWSTEDPSTPASAWSPECKAQNDAVKPVLAGFADTYERLAHASAGANPTLADFGALAAHYGQAFVAGIPTYTAADLYLYNVFQKTAGVITSACRAAGSQ